MITRPSVEIPPAVFTHCSIRCERCCGPHLSARAVATTLDVRWNLHSSSSEMTSVADIANIHRPKQSEVLVCTPVTKTC